ncbi:hypothetical protein SFUMM280S_03623 [Streptomyces fumanus]
MLPEPRTMPRWNSRSQATSVSTDGSSPSASNWASSASSSASPIRPAAIAVAAGSRMRRTARNSRTVSSRWKSTTKLSASSRSCGSRLVT